MTYYDVLRSLIGEEVSFHEGNYCFMGLEIQDPEVLRSELNDIIVQIVVNS